MRSVPQDIQAQMNISGENSNTSIEMSNSEVELQRQYNQKMRPQSNNRMMIPHSINEFEKFKVHEQMMNQAKADPFEIYSKLNHETPEKQVSNNGRLSALKHDQLQSSIPRSHSSYSNFSTFDFSTQRGLQGNMNQPGVFQSNSTQSFAPLPGVSHPAAHSHANNVRQRSSPATHQKLGTVGKSTSYASLEPHGLLMDSKFQPDGQHPLFFADDNYELRQKSPTASFLDDWCYQSNTMQNSQPPAKKNSRASGSRSGANKAPKQPAPPPQNNTIITSAISEAEKKTIRRANNRVAAAKCRRKKMEAVLILQAKNEKLCANINQLSSVFAKIFAQRNMLIEQVKRCQCPNVTNSEIMAILRDYETGAENNILVNQFADMEHTQEEKEILSSACRDFK